MYSTSLRRFEVKIITYPSKSYSLAIESVKRPSSSNSRKKEKTGRVAFSNSSQSSTPTLLFLEFSHLILRDYSQHNLPGSPIKLFNAS